MAFIEPCFGIGHNLSLICQMTSEDIKHQLIIIRLLWFQILTDSAACSLPLHTILYQVLIIYIPKMNSCVYVCIYIMEWWSVEGQDACSGVSKNGDHSRPTAAIRFYLLSRRQFSAHPKSSLARIDKRTALSLQ